jgi:hypothetical protein
MTQAVGLQLNKLMTANPGRCPWAGMNQAFGLKGQAFGMKDMDYSWFTQRERIDARFLDHPALLVMMRPPAARVRRLNQRHA